VYKSIDGLHKTAEMLGKDKYYRMTNPDPNPVDPQGDSPQEERIGELINEFFDRRERGETVSEEQFLAQYPEHADELRQHLGGLHLLGALGSSADGNTVSRLAKPKFRGSSAENVLAESSQPIPNIPGYQVQKLIGRGGMGLVYKSVQVSTKRVVALKVLLEGPFATETARRRFEREIALAAQLRHPNIIPIYDSGTVDGRMYYAMEYVFGLGLSDYIKTHGMDLRSRVQLLIKVFTAVSHAHQRGVIHRDLKPSNILVDGNGEPHILDFGLATAGSIGDATTSITAQIIGTPAYMSPEQASADPNSVDIRTDVYSLGIVLYEAICGGMPYETNVGIGRILHNIAHAEPVPPAKQNAKIDAELAAIALKSIDKLKENRYQSVEGFAEDLRRYLAGEPILARPPTGIYLLKRAISRHRAPVAIVAILLISTIASLWGIRKYATVTKEREQSLQQQIADITQKKEAAVKQLEESKAPPTQEAGLDAILRTMSLPPELIPFAKIAVDPKASSQDKTAALAMIALAKLKDAGADKETSFKQPSIQDVNPPMYSRRPPETIEKPPQKDATPELYKELLRLSLERALAAGAVPTSTSQPSTQVSSSQPATSQSVITVPHNAPASQPATTGT
jgi:serine/threonine protein kinase